MTYCLIMWTSSTLHTARHIPVLITETLWDQFCVRYNQAVDISLYLKFCLCRIPVYSGFGLDVFHYNVKMFTMLYYKWSCLFFFHIRSRIFNGNRVGIDELVLYNETGILHKQNFKYSEMSTAWLYRTQNWSQRVSA
jgi:hypothetical protein